MTAREEKALRHIDCLWTWLVTVHYGDVLVYANVVVAKSGVTALQATTEDRSLLRPPDSPMRTEVVRVQPMVDAKVDPAAVTED